MTRIDDCRRSGDCELEFGCVCVCARVLTFRTGSNTLLLRRWSGFRYDVGLFLHIYMV